MNSEQVSLESFAEAGERLRGADIHLMSYIHVFLTCTYHGVNPGAVIARTFYCTVSIPQCFYLYSHCYMYFMNVYIIVLSILCYVYSRVSAHP